MRKIKEQMIKTTCIAANGDQYEVELSDMWFNGTIHQNTSGRSYPFTAYAAETIEEAIDEAAEWCTWHSARNELCEVQTKDGLWRCI